MAAQVAEGIKSIAGPVRGGWAAITGLRDLLWAEVKANGWLLIVAALMAVAGYVMATRGLVEFERIYPGAEKGKSAPSLAIVGISAVAGLVALVNLAIALADRVFKLKMPLIPVAPTANLELALRTVAPIAMGMFISLTVFR